MLRTPFISMSSQNKTFLEKDKLLENKIKLNISTKLDQALFIYNGNLSLKTFYFNFKNFKDVLNDQELLNARAFIFSEMNIHLANFGINYNIPNIWIHKTIQPESWNNLFRLIIIGDQNKIDIWRSIWKLV